MFLLSFSVRGSPRVLVYSCVLFPSHLEMPKGISRLAFACVPCIRAGIGTLLQCSGLDGDFTGERGPRCIPLLRVGRLARAEVDALCPEFCGTARLRRATEDVRLPGDLEVNESRSHDRGLQFCFQQSTSNSARPQIDLLFRVRWHRGTHQDIPDLEATAGFEDPGHLLQGSELVWQQVEDTVGDDHIGPTGRRG